MVGAVFLGEFGADAEEGPGRRRILVPSKKEWLEELKMLDIHLEDVSKFLTVWARSSLFHSLCTTSLDWGWRSGWGRAVRLPAS